MNKKANGAASRWIPTPPWVPLPQTLVVSPAWKALGINARRLLDFLMHEWMNHAGQRNGFLLAPRRQLEDFGIGARHITAAITEAERLGLIDVIRGKGRSPSRYALTWLPLAGETEPTNRWHSHNGQPTSRCKTDACFNDFRREASRVYERKSRSLWQLPKGSHKGQKQGYPKGSTFIEKFLPTSKT